MTNKEERRRAIEGGVLKMTEEENLQNEEDWEENTYEFTTVVWGFTRASVDVQRRLLFNHPLREVGYVHA